MRDRSTKAHNGVEGCVSNKRYIRERRGDSSLDSLADCPFLSGKNLASKFQGASTDVEKCHAVTPLSEIP